MRKPQQTFIQWKGTHVCMDIHCPVCGMHGHIDAEFAYAYQCCGCKTIFQVGQEVSLTALTAESAKAAGHMAHWFENPTTGHDAGAGETCPGCGVDGQDLPTWSNEMERLRAFEANARSHLAWALAVIRSNELELPRRVHYQAAMDFLGLPGICVGCGNPLAAVGETCKGRYCQEAIQASKKPPG